MDALADDVMNGVLGPGVRRIASHTDAALASEKKDIWSPVPLYGGNAFRGVPGAWQ